jgi:hypothetical protein
MQWNINLSNEKVVAVREREECLLYNRLEKKNKHILVESNAIHNPVKRTWKVLSVKLIFSCE